MARGSSQLRNRKRKRKRKRKSRKIPITARFNWERYRNGKRKEEHIVQRATRVGIKKGVGKVHHTFASVEKYTFTKQFTFTSPTFTDAVFGHP